jgi:hypothetical protein
LAAQRLAIGLLDVAGRYLAAVPGFVEPAGPKRIENSPTRQQCIEPVQSHRKVTVFRIVVFGIHESHLDYLHLAESLYGRNTWASRRRGPLENIKLSSPSRSLIKINLPLRGKAGKERADGHESAGPLAAEAPEIASPARPFLAVALETACASIAHSPSHGGGPRIGPARDRFTEAMSPVDTRSRAFCI